MKGLRSNIYLQMAVFCTLGLVAGMFLRDYSSDFWNCIFVAALVCAFVVGSISARAVLLFCLTVSINMMARGILLVDDTPKKIFYYGFASAFIVSLAGFLGSIPKWIYNKTQDYQESSRKRINSENFQKSLAERSVGSKTENVAGDIPSSPIYGFGIAICVLALCIVVIIYLRWEYPHRDTRQSAPSSSVAMPDSRSAIRRGMEFQPRGLSNKPSQVKIIPLGQEIQPSDLATASRRRKANRPRIIRLGAELIPCPGGGLVEVGQECPALNR